MLHEGELLSTRLAEYLSWLAIYGENSRRVPRAAIW